MVLFLLFPDLEHVTVWWRLEEPKGKEGTDGEGGGMSCGEGECDGEEETGRMHGVVVLEEVTGH